MVQQQQSRLSGPPRSQPQLYFEAKCAFATEWIYYGVQRCWETVNTAYMWLDRPDRLMGGKSDSCALSCSSRVRLCQVAVDCGRNITTVLSAGREAGFPLPNCFSLHLFKRKALLHDYAERYDIISDWQTDIWSQISQAGLLLLEMHGRLQLLKDYLNACAEVLTTHAGADFSDLGLNWGSLGASFRGPLRLWSSSICGYLSCCWSLALKRL